MIRGSCKCGQCSYEASGELVDVLHCHCSICRKLTGSAFATYGGVLNTDFKWLCESSSISKIKTSQHVSRYFCNACGSLITSMDAREERALYLSLGLLDSDTAINPQYHQHVASKAHWFEINDDLPQFMEDNTD